MAADQQRMETVYENPYILMTTKPISHPNDLMPALGAIARSPRPLVILAEKVDGAALGMLIHNSSHGTLEAVAVRAPGFGHRRIAHLQDLAVFTGGHVITDETGLALENVELSWLGSARRVVIGADSTTFVEGAGSAEAVEARLGQIRGEIERATQERDLEVAQERLATLSSKLAVIRVGAATDVELGEKRRRTEGALAATRAAVVRGHRARRRHRAAARRGGARRASSSRATTRPAPTSCGACCPSRCSGSRRTPATTVRPSSTRSARCRPGRASTRSPGEFGDLIEQGVIDPVRVTRLTLQHAASVAALLLTTEAVVAEELIAQPGAVIAPGFGDLAEGLARPSSPI